MNWIQTVATSVSEWYPVHPLAHARGYRNVPKRAAIGLMPIAQRLWTALRWWSALTSTRLNRLRSSGSTQQCGSRPFRHPRLVALPAAAAAPVRAGLALGVAVGIPAAVARPAGRTAVPDLLDCRWCRLPNGSQSFQVGTRDRVGWFQSQGFFVLRDGLRDPPILVKRTPQVGVDVG